ncbi:PDZ domain-containing protein [Arthrobacter liuii]|uniref:PDZ domain-containing protein n=1 Tax=Arthrobacter liuii TaxID=1476996 RepID=UPI0035EB152A
MAPTVHVWVWPSVVRFWRRCPVPCPQGCCGPTPWSAGDIITKFAQTQIGNVTDLLVALRRQDPGQQVDIVVQRGSTPQTLHVTLGNVATAP